MSSEPRNNTVNMSQVLWNNWTMLLTGENILSVNTTNITNTHRDSENVTNMTIKIVTIAICLCGMVGNGIVIWLLGFCMKRNPYGVYILNLAIADFFYLSTNILGILVFLKLIPFYLFWFTNTLGMFTYLVGLSLLMAISVERCVSVLWPIWYKCHRPAHLSTIMCILIWVLFLIFWLVILIRFPYSAIGDGFRMWLITGMMSFPTFLVLLVSSLTLFIRVQCYSRKRKPSKLYWTILLNVLAFLLFSVPRGLYLAFCWFSWSTFHNLKVWSFVNFFCTLNSLVNPIIYFFVGQHGQQWGRKPLREVLRSALDSEESEQRTRAQSSDRA